MIFNLILLLSIASLSLNTYCLETGDDEWEFTPLIENQNTSSPNSEVATQKPEASIKNQLDEKIKITIIYQEKTGFWCCSSTNLKQLIIEVEKKDTIRQIKQIIKNKLLEIDKSYSEINIDDISLTDSNTKKLNEDIQIGSIKLIPTLFFH